MALPILQMSVKDEVYTTRRQGENAC